MEPGASTRASPGPNEEPAGGGIPPAYFVWAGGVWTRVLEQGAGDPVLFIHGLGGWAELWRDLMPRVVRAGFRAIACDLPGFGQSAPPPEPVRYLDGDEPYYARFIRDLLRAVGAERARLVGHSLGGAVAAAAAMTYPEHVGGLVLVAPGGLGVRVAPRIRACGLPLAPQLVRYAPSALMRDYVRANFHDPARVAPWLYEDAERYGRSPEAYRVLSQLVTVRGPRLGLMKKWLHRARGIRCPTLIVWGREDRILPLPSEELLRTVPGSRTVLIPRAGHLVMLEQHAEFASALDDFLCPPGEGEAATHVH